MWQQFDETLEHISACPILAEEHYVKKHDRVCIKIHFNIRKETGVKLENEHRYDHVPNSVETSHEVNVTTLWNQQVRTDRTIPNNKLDIIILDNKRGTCMLLVVVTPGDRIVIKKEAEKLLK